MNPYEEWNLLFLQHFFSPGSVGSDIWFSTAQDDIETIGQHLGGDRAFIRAVADGPPWPTVQIAGRYIGRGARSDFRVRALALLEQRQRPGSRPTTYVDPEAYDPTFDGLNAPCFLPMLAALVRSAGAFGSDGYYATLNADLGLTAFGPVQMHQIESLWLDLETWSELNAGRVGRFERRVLGGFRLIGVPKSQVILSRRDTESLPRLFDELGAHPDATISDALLTRMADHVRGGGLTYLSTGFREATVDGEFRELLRGRLSAALADWDGTRPIDDDRNASNVIGGRGVGVAELRLALLVGEAQGGVIAFEDVPLVPRLRDSGFAELDFQSTSWRAPFTRDEWSLGESDTSPGTSLLAAAAGMPLDLEVICADVIDGEVVRSAPRTARLRQSGVRYFVWDEGVPTPRGFAAVLVERRSPPAAATFFIIATPPHLAIAIRVLQEHAVEHVEQNVQGLAAGWKVIRIADAAHLGAARAELPGVWSSAPQPRAMRLIGGQRVTRGGSRYFLDYDPPALEVDAPDGATLVAVGVTLKRVSSSSGAEQLGTSAVTGLSVRRIARYDIDIPSIGARHFAIRLEDERGGLIASVTLRLATDGLERYGGRFGIDRFGQPARAGEDCARGACVPTTLSTPPSTTFEIRSMGRVASPHDIVAISDTGVALFLDALALKQSMPSANARDLIARLLVRESRPIGSAAFGPNDILRTLWIRGFLEIEADRKGRWRMVHAVPPTLYTLALQLADGGPLASLSGTLTRASWRELANRTPDLARVWITHRAADAMPVVVLTAEARSSLESLAAENQLQFSDYPATKLAAWAGDLREMIDAWRESSIETPGRTFDETAQRFLPQSGDFGQSRGPTDFPTKLFRATDPDTMQTSLHMIEMKDSVGRDRFAFVRDQWWGRWAALSAAASVFARILCRQELEPWPIPYSKAAHSLWLPGRLALPVLLARALVLASGDSPRIHHAARGPHLDGRLALITADMHIRITSVSEIYDGFLTDPPNARIWLEYRWVPEDVADAVANKLGGRLDVYD